MLPSNLLRSSDNQYMHSLIRSGFKLRTLALQLPFARHCAVQFSQWYSNKTVRPTMQVLSAQENLPSTTMEPPAKQPRLQQPACSFKVKLLNENATPPKRGSALAAGYDLSSSEDCVIPARGKLAVKTGLSIHVPHGTYGRVAPRSGLAAKHFIDVGAGVIDEDYRGEVMVLLFNHSDSDFKVNKGDRIAQLVLECIVTPEVEVVDDLDDTSRGAGGFGSTGGFNTSAAQELRH